MDEANPIKTDAELQMLVTKLDNIKKYKTFQRWKDKFLNRLDDFLYEKGMEPAEKACNTLEDMLKKLVQKTTKLLDFIHKGDLGEERKTVKASLALNEMCNTLENVRNEIETLIPSLKSDERRKGFSKFHLGAALIRQGFHQYVSMKAVEDAVQEIGDRLVNVADKQQHELFYFYHTQVQRFCDVMADLNLYKIMMKCVEFSEPPDEEESEDPEYIQITVETEDGKSIPMEVIEQETVTNIKEATAACCGIPVPRQILKFKGNVLSDNEATMKALGVEDGAVIFLERLKIPITVNAPDGKTIQLMVDPSNYITDLKRLLEPESGIPGKNQMLSLNGQELNDRSTTLDDCGIEPCSVLELEPKSIKVIVKMPDGQEVELDISPSDDPQAMKEKLAAKTDMPVPRQVLKYNGDEIPPDTTAKQANLKDGSILEVDVFKIPLTVNNWDGNRIELMVDPTIYVTDLKRQLEPESGIPAKNQHLSKDGEELADRSKKVEDYGIEAGAVLDLEPKSIIVDVEMPDGKEIELELALADDSNAIKEKIAARSGMAIPRQVVKYNGEELPIDTTAKQCGLKDGSKLQVEVFKIPITVNNWDGTPIELSVEPTDDLLTVKKLLEPESGIPPDNQALSLEDTKLEDDSKPISDLGVKAGSVLDLEPKLITVNVETPDGEKHEVDVAPSDTSDEIKEKVAAKTGMAPVRQVVKFNGEELPGDGATVKDMGIKEGSDLVVEVFKVPVTVNSWDGTSTELMVDPTEDLASLKKQLEPECGIPPDNQRLFLEGDELVDDTKPAGDHGIKAGSVLELEPKSVKVAIEMPDGQEVEVDLSPSDDVSAIKQKIQAVTGMEVPRQVLKNEDLELPSDGQTVKDLGIRAGSKLKVDIFKIPVTVNNWDGTQIEILIEPSEQLSDIKVKIEPESGIAVDNQALSRDGAELTDDSKTASEYGIEKGCVLDLEPKLIQVDVEMPDGSTHEVSIALSDNPDAIKKAIESKTGMAAQRQVVKYNGEELPIDTTAKQCGLRDGSKLQVEVFKIPITVNNWDGTPIELSVEPTDDLLTVKKLLEPESGIPPDNQALSLEDTKLEDDSKPISDLGVKAGSVLDLEPKLITVNVETPDGEKHEVDVAPSDTSDEIKEKIAAKTGMAPVRQVVKFNGEELPGDGATVKDMGIKEGSDLIVEVFKVPVTVNSWDGTSTELMVDPTEDLASLKKQLEPECGIPPDNQRLFLEGDELVDDTKPAGDHGIKAGSVLELEPKSVKVAIEMPDGQEVEVDLSPSDDVSAIKQKIQAVTGMEVPRQVLKNEDLELPSDGQTVKDLGIRAGSKLKVDIFKIPVTVNNWDGTQIEILIEPSEQLSDIKVKIEPESGIAVDNQALSRDGAELTDDSKTASEYGIEKGCVLDLEPKLIQVDVEMPDGSTHEVSIALSDNPDAIKKAIESKTGMAAQRQVVKYNGEELPIDTTAKQCGLRDGSKLQVEVFKIPITVNNWDGTPIELSVEPTDDLLTVKKLLEPESGIPPDNQALSLEDTKLEDDSKPISDLGVKAGSVLDLEPKLITVNVETPDGEKHEVDVAPSDTSDEIKEKIAAKTGMAPVRQVVKFNGEELPGDGATVKDMGIKEGSDLIVEVFKVPVTVNSWDGTSTELMVDPTEDLASLKKQLEPECGIPPDNQRLFLEGDELVDDTKPAGDHGIKAGSVLELEPKSVKVAIEMPDGQEVEVDLSPSDDVSAIKEKIEAQTGLALPRQVLKQKGQEVPNEAQTVKELGVREGDKMQVEILKIPITVNAWDGKVFPMLVEPTEALADIKKRLEPELGIAVDNQALFKDGNELLEDKLTASKHGIKSGTCLDLEPKVVRVNALFPDGKTQIVELSPSDDSAGIKMKIEQQTGMEAPRQVLKFNGTELPKKVSVKDMGIREGSNINVEIFKIPVIVNTWDSKRIEIMVDPTAKLIEIKQELVAESGIAAKNQLLSMKEVELSDDNKRAAAYGIEGGTVLDLEPRFIEISVDMPDGTTCSFEVTASDSGDDVKGKVASKTSIAVSRQVLMHGQKEMLADYTVKGMGIKDGTTLKCELYKIPITVETHDKKTIHLRIEPVDTIDTVKSMLEKETGMAPRKQVLSLFEKELDKGKRSATEYGIKKGSVLLLEPKDDPIVFVDVKTGAIFGVDRDDVVDKGVLTAKNDNRFEFDETEGGSFGKEKMLKAMLDSPNLGVKPQIVVEKVEVEDYDLQEAENVKSKWGVQLKKTQKAKKGDDFIFVDIKTGSVGLLDRKACIEKGFITLVGFGKDETLKEAEHNTKTRDKYVNEIRRIFGVKTAT